MNKKCAKNILFFGNNVEFTNTYCNFSCFMLYYHGVKTYQEWQRDWPCEARQPVLFKVLNPDR